MTLKKAFITVILSAIACAVIEASLGWCIGTFAPDAYAGMIDMEPVCFLPVQFGVVVGLIQGLFTGIGLAIILVGIVAWHDVRIRQISQQSSYSGETS